MNKFPPKFSIEENVLIYFGRVWMCIKYWFMLGTEKIMKDGSFDIINTFQILPQICYFAFECKIFFTYSRPLIFLINLLNTFSFAYYNHFFRLISLSLFSHRFWLENNKLNVLCHKTIMVSRKLLFSFK